MRLPMMTRGVFRSVFACVLMLCLSSGIFSAGNPTLCLGEDGHRQVAYANHGCCAAPFAPQEPLLRFSADDVQTDAKQDHCDSCVDIPLLVGAMKFLPGPRTVNPEPLSPASAMLCAYLDPCLDCSSNRAVPTPISVPPHSTLQSHRTVVLLV